LSWFRRDSGRPLTPGERRLAAGIFGDALDPVPVRIHRAKYFPLQPRNVAMAPDGGVWFHPDGGLWRPDFAEAPDRLQAFLIHELTHVWQHQQGLCLLVRRHPFCRYDYQIVPGKPLQRYGIEQQAMIVEHASIARRAGKSDARLEALLKEAGFGTDA
jgi:hypothetical protein